MKIILIFLVFLLTSFEINAARPSKALQFEAVDITDSFVVAMGEPIDQLCIQTFAKLDNLGRVYFYVKNQGWYRRDLDGSLVAIGEKRSFEEFQVANANNVFVGKNEKSCPYAIKDGLIIEFDFNKFQAELQHLLPNEEISKVTYYNFMFCNLNDSNIAVGEVLFRVDRWLEGYDGGRYRIAIIWDLTANKFSIFSLGEWGEIGGINNNGEILINYRTPGDLYMTIHNYFTGAKRELEDRAFKINNRYLLVGGGLAPLKDPNKRLSIKVKNSEVLPEKVEGRLVDLNERDEILFVAYLTPRKVFLLKPLIAP